jgi:DNA-binding MarR family transcriptional regulator
MGQTPPVEYTPSLADALTGQLKRTVFDSAVTVRLVATAAAIDECAKLILSDSYFIGLTQLRIIAYLAECRGVSVSELGRDLQIDKAWISRLLKQLEKRKLVDRMKHESDPRQLVISLTPDGEIFHANVMKRVAPYRAQIIESIDEQLLNGLLDRMENNIRSLNARLRSGG